MSDRSESTETVPELGSDVLLSAYWERMPAWAKRQYHNDGLTNMVVKGCAQRGDSPEELAWELARALSGDREGVRKKLLDLVERGGLGIVSDISDNDY